MSGQDNATLKEAATSHAEAIAEAGRAAFAAGWMIGPDRVEARTQHGFGDDRVAALGYVLEIGGDLALGTIQLLSDRRTYSANALLRQLIEVEYLVAAFGESPEDARTWLDADEATIRSMFQPANVRNRVPGRFRFEEYRAHCELGGHPNPKARALLHGHSAALPIELTWAEVDYHLARLCARVEEAATSLQETGAAIPLFVCARDATGVSRHEVDWHGPKVRKLRDGRLDA